MSADPLIPPPAAITLEAPSDVAAADRIVMAAFGPGRYAKAAERLREASAPVVGFVARDEAGGVVGSVRLWPIRIGEADALFLGPIAVDPASRREGVGADLVGACLAWAEARGRGVLLVGDAPYFGRFDFTRADGVRLPGPVDAGRVLWRGPDHPSGPVRAA